MRTLALVASLIAMAAIVSGCGSSSQSATSAGRAHSVEPQPRARPSLLILHNATPQPGWQPYTGPVPILVYHELGNPPPSEPYPGLYVSDSDFKAEMQWLHANGWQAVTLDEVMNAWYHDGVLPAKPIVITFRSEEHTSELQSPC